MVNNGLTPEQEYLLKRVALESKGATRDELVEALLECWEARLMQKQAFMAATKEAGLCIRMEIGATLCSPETEEDFEQIFGYSPSEEEAGDYVKELWENATMELDMDEIVLGSEE